MHERIGTRKLEVDKLGKEKNVAANCSRAEPARYSRNQSLIQMVWKQCKKRTWLAGRAQGAALTNRGEHRGSVSGGGRGVGRQSNRGEQSAPAGGRERARRAVDDCDR